MVQNTSKHQFASKLTLLEEVVEDVVGGVDGGLHGRESWRVIGVDDTPETLLGVAQSGRAEEHRRPAIRSLRGFLTDSGGKSWKLTINLMVCYIQ